MFDTIYNYLKINSLFLCNLLSCSFFKVGQVSQRVSGSSSGDLHGRNQKPFCAPGLDAREIRHTVLQQPPGKRKLCRRLMGQYLPIIAARPPGRAWPGSIVLCCWRSCHFPQDVDCDLRCYLGFLDVVDHLRGQHRPR